MTTGIQAAQAQPIQNPLPTSWLGLPTAPPTPPSWAQFGGLSAIQIRNLLAQIAYDTSAWNYQLVGANNQLGRYQVSVPVLEAYGLLSAGSYETYGSAAVNYQHCWQPLIVNNGQNVYQNYFYNITNQTQFLHSTVAQEHLAYQRLVDIYINSINTGTILSSDNSDIVAGMIYVGWTLSVGNGPSPTNINGTGSWAWRFNNIGSGSNSFNSGRYAITVLSQ